MGELIIALAPLLALVGVALLAMFVPVPYLGTFSLSFMAIGFLFGVPSGVYYHVLLWRALRRKGPAPKGWYWRPTRYHGVFDDREARQVWRWFVVGAAGFTMIVFGFLLAVLTLFLWLRASR